MTDARTPTLSAVLLALTMAFFTVLGPAPLAADPYESAFEALRQPTAVADRTLQRELIEQNFLQEPEDATPFLLKRLWSHPSPGSFPPRQARELDLLVARSVLAAMPAAVQDKLARAEADDPYRKSRLLEALGGFRTPLALARLQESLSDSRVAGLESGPPEGWALRVCDVAYNTLTHRLQLDGFRSPLGVGHSHAQRDRWIGRLAEWLETHAPGATAAFAAAP